MNPTRQKLVAPHGTGRLSNLGRSGMDPFPKLYFIPSLRYKELEQHNASNQCFPPWLSWLLDFEELFCGLECEDFELDGLA